MQRLETLQREGHSGGLDKRIMGNHRKVTNAAWKKRYLDEGNCQGVNRIKRRGIRGKAFVLRRSRGKGIEEGKKKGAETLGGATLESELFTRDLRNYV